MRIKRETIHTNKDADIWIRLYAKQHRLVQIGSGAFATAYTTSKRRGRTVTKIGLCENTTFKRDAYCNYLQHVVLKNQKNPLMPKIFSARFVKLLIVQPNAYCGDYKETQGIYIVKMERLNRFHKVKMQIRTKLLWSVGLEDVGEVDRPKKVAARDPSGYFKPIAKPLHKLMRKFGDDCHEGNFMWRGAGKHAQLVIIDPVA